MKRDFIVSGIHIGEHSFEPEQVKKEIDERCIKAGLDFVTIRTKRTSVPKHYFLDWAKYLAGNKIYFSFLYTTQHAPEGEISQFDAETVSEIKKIAGEYFLGDILGELGSQFACKWKGYGSHTPQNIKSLYEAKQTYLKLVNHYVDIEKSLGLDGFIMSVEATGLSKYNAEAGVNIPMLELMCGNPEILVSGLRGTARAFGAKLWGTYVAHEWYGGMRHDDVLKQKRLKLAYNYAYMSGTNILCLESGDEAINSYGYNFNADDECCKHYQQALKDFARFKEGDNRPAGGPKVRVAFVQGNLDAWGSWGGSSLWSQFDKEEWGHSAPEYTWRVLEELGNRRNWYDIANFGGNDLSAAPAYGMYDVIPAESSFEAMKRYDYIIFTGWNTMTEEIYANLEKYVENGGTLFMLASHLNENDRRDEKIRLFRNGNVESLFGCRIKDNGFRTNAGVKFVKNSITGKLMYPGTTTYVCDPIYSHGYVSYADTELTGGFAAARLSHSFREKEDFINLPVALVENRLGKGTAILLTTLNHAGDGAVYPIYRALVREIVTASHRECPIKVYGSDRVRFAVYEGDVIYLLNTDYDSDANVIIEKHGQTIKETIGPCEIKRV